jgi:hypothetical protein
MPSLCLCTGVRGLPRSRHRGRFWIHENSELSTAPNPAQQTSPCSRIPQHSAVPVSVRRRASAPAPAPRCLVRKPNLPGDRMGPVGNAAGPCLRFAESGADGPVCRIRRLPTQLPFANSDAWLDRGHARGRIRIVGDAPRGGPAGACFVAKAMATYSWSPEVKAIARPSSPASPEAGDTGPPADPRRTTVNSPKQSPRPTTSSWLEVTGGSSVAGWRRRSKECCWFVKPEATGSPGAEVWSQSTLVLLLPAGVRGTILALGPASPDKGEAAS